MKRDRKPPSLSAVVPSWAQELRIAPLRPLKASVSEGFSAMSAFPKPELLRVDGAAAVLQVSSKTICRLIARGDLKAVRIGRLVRIHSSEIDRLIAGSCPRGGDSEGGKNHD